MRAATAAAPGDRMPVRGARVSGPSSQEGPVQSVGAGLPAKVFSCSTWQVRQRLAVG